MILGLLLATVMHPRTAIHDRILYDLELEDPAAVDAILDASLSSSQTAIDNSHALLDFEEYQEAVL